MKDQLHRLVVLRVLQQVHLLRPQDHQDQRDQHLLMRDRLLLLPVQQLRRLVRKDLSARMLVQQLRRLVRKDLSVLMLVQQLRYHVHLLAQAMGHVLDQL
jgi:hypothetical protein